MPDLSRSGWRLPPNTRYPPIQWYMDEWPSTYVHLIGYHAREDVTVSLRMYPQNLWIRTI